MSAIMDIYQLIRDWIDEAERQKNDSLVSALIDIKKKVSDLEDENRDLRRLIEMEESIVRHADNTYITLKDDPLGIKYCSTCWGNEKKLIQLKPEEERARYDQPLCPICLEKYLKAKTGGK